jgi:hypothetical protein
MLTKDRKSANFSEPPGTFMAAYPNFLQPYILGFYILGFTGLTIGITWAIDAFIDRRKDQIGTLVVIADKAQSRGDHHQLISIAKAFGGRARRQAIIGLIQMSVEGRKDVLQSLRINVGARELRRILCSGQDSSPKADGLRYWLRLPGRGSVEGASCVERLVAFALGLRPLSELEAPLTEMERDAVAQFKRRPTIT